MLLWVAQGTIDSQARELIEVEADEVLVSAATIWELEIKRALGRLDAPSNLSEVVREAGYASLPVTFEHAIEAGWLPSIHADPFDRMLVAQARVEGLTLATADNEIGAYEVATLQVLRA